MWRGLSGTARHANRTQGGNVETVSAPLASICCYERQSSARSGDQPFSTTFSQLAEILSFGAREGVVSVEAEQRLGGSCAGDAVADHDIGRFSLGAEDPDRAPVLVGDVVREDRVRDGDRAI